MYLDNKYTHWYNDIINAAKTRSKPNSYTEKLNNKICNVIDLNGNIVVTDNLKQYCIENNLNYQAMMAVARGKQKQHRGYECKWI